MVVIWVKLKEILGLTEATLPTICSGCLRLVRECFYKDFKALLQKTYAMQRQLQYLAGNFDLKCQLAGTLWGCTKGGMIMDYSACSRPFQLVRLVREPVTV